jgi:uncharacterized delta-60 repeat protein
MGRRGIQLLCLIAAAAALALAAAGAALAGGRPELVKTQAPGGLDHVVADGSRLLLFHSRYGVHGTITRVNLDGSVDRSFGEGGTVHMDLEDVAVQPDGKILVAGSGPRGEGKGGSVARVTRLLPDGEPDPSFGVDGNADVDFGLTEDRGEAVAVAADGDVLLAGIRIDEVDELSEFGASIAVARFTPDGQLDTSFGEGGFTALPNYGEVVAEDVVATPSGGVVVEGGNDLETFFWALDGEGSTDTRFGDKGFVEVKGRPIGDRHHEFLLVNPGIVETPGGKLLLTAKGVSEKVGPVSLRLLPDGRPDPSYGQHGWSTLRAKSGLEIEEVGATLLPGGGLAVAARKGKTSGAIAIGGNGQLDRSFGAGGRCLARGTGAVDVAVVGGRVVVLRKGPHVSRLLVCPPLRRGR